MNESVGKEEFSEGGTGLYANNCVFPYQEFLYCDILNPKDCPTVLEPFSS